MAYNAGGSSGNLVLIQKKTASNSASIDFTTGITGYDIYKLIINDMIVQTSGQKIILQYSNDAGSSWITTNYSTQGAIARTAAGLQGLDESLTGHEIFNSADNGSSFPCNGEITMYGLSNSAVNKLCYINTCFFIVGGVFWHSLASQQLTTAVVTGLRVISASGNIVSGTFKLYGVAN